jgi:hypothetical protein
VIGMGGIDGETLEFMIAGATAVGTDFAAVHLDETDGSGNFTHGWRVSDLHDRQGFTARETMDKPFIDVDTGGRALNRHRRSGIAGGRRQPTVSRASWRVARRARRACSST